LQQVETHEGYRLQEARLMQQTVWMRPPDGGPPKEVPADPVELVPLMVAGWSQCEPPEQPDRDEEN
jgi:hypothetical protein